MRVEMLVRCARKMHASEVCSLELVVYVALKMIFRGEVSTELGRCDSAIASGPCPKQPATQLCCRHAGIPSK